jgi:hypothetical protein
MGRPPGRIQDRPFQMRVSEVFLESIDGWRAKQEGRPSRAEAIRQLVEIGLSKPEAPQRAQVLSTAKESAARAVELAGKAIDKRSDKSVSDDERTVRKRKLIQGPSVFRNTRKDRPGK